MKTRTVFAALSVLGLLASLSPYAGAVDSFHTQTIAQNASALSAQQATEKHYEDELMKKHETVAKYYEDEAKKMQAKTRELKVLLEHYEEKSYLYGKKAQDLQAHTEALVRKYEQAAKADAKEAASHRQIALRLKEKNHAAPRTERLTAINESHRNSR
jgi:hypothetical protein